MIKILVTATDNPDYLGEHTFYFNEVTLNDSIHHPLSDHSNLPIKIVIDPSKPQQFHYATEIVAGSKSSHSPSNPESASAAPTSIKQNNKIAPPNGIGIKNDTFTLADLMFKILDFELEKPYHREEEWKSLLQDPRNLQPSAQRVIANLLDETED